MEDILKQILNKLDSLEMGQHSFDKKLDGFEQKLVDFGNRQDSFEQKLVDFGNRQDRFEEKLMDFDNRQDRFEDRMTSLEKGQDAIALEQCETRKEVGFYYASMMKKFDEGKKELSSEIKQVTAVQKEHQNVLEFLNEKQ